MSTKEVTSSIIIMWCMIHFSLSIEHVSLYGKQAKRADSLSSNFLIWYDMMLLTRIKEVLRKAINPRKKYKNGQSRYKHRKQLL